MLRDMDPTTSPRTLRWTAWLAALLGGCAPVYYVVRSTPLREKPAAAAPAPAPAAQPLVGLERIALVPWESCTSPAQADDCGRALGALERALLEHGFEVVPWQTVHELAQRHDKSTLEAAQQLSIGHLVRLQAPRTEAAGERLRFARSYHASDAEGSVGEPLELAAREADRLDVLAGRSEQESQRAASALAVDVALQRSSGELVWSHRERVAQPAPPPRALTLWVRCEAGSCALKQQADAGSRRPARSKSERVLLPATSAPHLLERVAEPLAARLSALVAPAPAP
jgi:hypothetical protein